MDYLYQYTPTYASDDALAPLYCCLHYLITPAAPVHFHLARVLPPNMGFSGKEGWSLRIVRNHDDQVHYAAIGIPASPASRSPQGDYDIQTVRREIRATLDRFVATHPTRKLEVDAAIRRFNLTRDGRYSEPYILPLAELD